MGQVGKVMVSAGVLVAVSAGLMVGQAGKVVVQPVSGCAYA